jgi:hypothetical protein
VYYIIFADFVQASFVLFFSAVFSAYITLIFAKTGFDAPRFTETVSGAASAAVTIYAPGTKALSPDSSTLSNADEGSSNSAAADFPAEILTRLNPRSEQTGSFAFRFSFAI